MGRGFTVMHIYGNQLKNLQIAVPPIHEQDSIVDHINRGTAGIDDEIARCRRQIDLMNEYRTRLIADVVTGQLDVRGTATQLPAAP
jgi:type I restriction enzyme S subunit